MRTEKSPTTRLEPSADQTVALFTNFFYYAPKICYAVGYHKFVSLNLDGPAPPRIVLLCVTPLPSPPLPLAQTSTRHAILFIPIVKKEEKWEGVELKTVELKNRFMLEYRDLFNTHRRVIPSLYCLLCSSKSFRPAFGLCSYRTDRNLVPLPTEREWDRDRRHSTQICVSSLCLLLPYALRYCQVSSFAPTAEVSGA